MSISYNPLIGPSSYPGDSLSYPIIFFDDFTEGPVVEDGGRFSSTVDKGVWFAGLTGSGTIVPADDEAGGVAVMTTGATDNNSIECQVNGSAFLIAEGKDLEFETRFKVTTAANPLTTTDLFFGLTGANATVLDGVTDVIGFGTFDGTNSLLNAGGASLYAFCGTGMTDWTTTSAYSADDTTIDFVDSTYIVLKFIVSSNKRVQFMVNGKKRVDTKLYIPTGKYFTPTIALQTNASAAAAMRVDYIKVIQER